MTWLRLFVRNKTALTGLLLMLGMTAVSIFAPLITHTNPMKIDVPNKLKEPQTGFPMGTDNVGRDVFARVLYGGRLTLQVGALTVLFSALVGTAIGLAAGSTPRLDGWIMRAMDAIMAFPAILLAIAIVAALGPRVANVVAALSVVAIPHYARVVRSVVLVVRAEVYVEAARAAGTPGWRIMARHILPNCLSPIIIQATYGFATAVLAESALSFLGVGAPPAVPSWGNILSEGRILIAQAPWLTFFPGSAIVLVVLGMNLFGDGLRDALDPRLRGA